MGVITCWFLSRLGAFWYESVVCSARLGFADVRLDSPIAEQRAGARLLHVWLSLVRQLHDFYENLPQSALLSPALREGMPYPLRASNR
jgi:hypothetical protein